MLFASQAEHSVQPLVGGGARVGQPVVSAHGAGEHLEEGDLPDELVGDSAEDVHQGLRSGVGRDLGGFTADQHDGGMQVGRRADFADEVAEAVHAGSVRGGADEHREDRGLGDGASQRALDVGRVGLVAREVSLELVVVAADNLFHELLMALVLDLGEILGNRAGGLGAVLVVGVGNLEENVGDPAEVLLLTDGQFQGEEPAAQPAA